MIIWYQKSVVINKLSPLDGIDLRVKQALSKNIE